MSGIIEDEYSVSGRERRYSVATDPISSKPQKRKVSESGTYMHERYFSTKMLTKPITSFQEATGIQFSARKKTSSSTEPEIPPKRTFVRRKSKSFSGPVNEKKNELINTQVDVDKDEDEEDGPITITCSHPHDRKMLLHQDFAAPIDVVHNMIFTSSKWFYEFHVEREHTETVIGEWKNDGKITRVLTYTVPVKNSPLSSFALCTETQVMEKSTVPGKLYVCCVEITNTGIPYQDAFYVDVHICLSKIDSNKCSIYVDLEVKYRKSVWGMVKTFIEKNVYSGTMSHYEQLAKKLDTTIAQGINMVDRTEKIKEMPKTQKKTEITISREPLSKPEPPVRSATSWKLWVWLAVLILFLFNLGLHWRLSTLEGIAAPRVIPLAFQEGTFKKLFGDEAVLETLIEDLEYEHTQEINIWKDMIATTLKHMKMAEDELEKINEHMLHYEQKKANVERKLIEKFIDAEEDEKKKAENNYKERRSKALRQVDLQETSLNQCSKDERKRSVSGQGKVNKDLDD